MEYNRPTHLEVDLQVLVCNYHILKKHVFPRQVMAVLKANAYGHGLVPVAKALVEAGCAYIAVAYLEEGILLRNAGIEANILILGGIIGDRIPLFIKNNLTITASSIEKLQAIERHACAMKKTAHVHIKIDTGMERIGVHHYSAKELIAYAQKVEMVSVDGIFSHLSHADEANPNPTDKQLHKFMSVINKISNPGIRHLANSGAVLQYPQTWLDMVRVGLSLYGFSPNPAIPLLPGIQPALRWVSRIVYFKVIPKGASVSYGGTWTAPKQTRIVTIPVGYGDGYQRRMSGSAVVLIRGKKYPVVGSICMDQIMVDIGWDEAFNGEEVILLGKQKDNMITVEDLSSWADMINYEILCAINTRVPRIYLQ